MSLGPNHETICRLSLAAICWNASFVGGYENSFSAELFSYLKKNVVSVIYNVKIVSNGNRYIGYSSSACCAYRECNIVVSVVMVWRRDG